MVSAIGKKSSGPQEGKYSPRSQKRIFLKTSISEKKTDI